jgi:hypothetical protein
MHVLEGFDRLPLLARLLVWGAVVYVARTYIGWLPDGPLGIALGVGYVLALSVMLSSFVQARRDRKRRALLARLAADLHQLADTRGRQGQLAEVRARHG